MYLNLLARNTRSITYNLGNSYDRSIPAGASQNLVFKLLGLTGEIYAGYIGSAFLSLVEP
jgi:hypothetical protein